MIAASSFFLAGLIFWEAVLAPARLRRLGHGTALLMVVSAAVVGSLPGALMTFAPRLLYPMDADTLAICALTPLEDQELGGLVMWIVMDAIFFAIAGWLFVAWLRAAERSANLRMAARASLPVLVCALAPLLLAGCNQKAAGSRAGGNSDHGIALIKQYGCGACHVIPGIRDANGAVGPPLTAMGRRVFIAGMLRNSPDNMMAWIQDPQSIVPGNAMPNMRIGRDDARDIASYLGTLQ
jgi:cytochrome c2